MKTATEFGAFSCWLIGADTLLTECGDILLERGHEIHGVVTSAPVVRAWCERHGLRVVDADGDFGAALSERPFDILFAITHLAIIPDDVLVLPRRMAVNFHDGPLPRYAGLNAPVWALIADEKRYGVSWHVMTGGVDQGDLLKQIHFDVAFAETALSINTRCLAAAIESFPELVDELAAGTEVRTPQDLSARSYFGKHARPPAACLIDWTASVQSIDAFVRALTFGPYPNPVGAPKTRRLDGGDPFLVTAVEARTDERPENAADGDVLAVSVESLDVVAGDGVVSITGVASLLGEDLSIGALGVSVGDRLGVDAASADRLTELEEELARHEAFWTDRLRTAEAPVVPQARVSAVRDPELSRLPIELPGSFDDVFGDSRVAALLAGFGAYLARTGRAEAFTLDAALASVAESLSGGEDFYAPSVPMTFSLTDGQSVGDLITKVAGELVTLRSRGGYLRDVFARNSGLAGSPERARLPVGVGLGADEFEVLPGGLLSLLVPDAGLPVLVVDGARIDDDDAKVIRASLETCFAAMAADVDQPWTELRLVSEEGLQLQLTEWNDTDVPYDRDSSVHRLFEMQADRTPDATAVISDGVAVSYRELDERANALARYLMELGVERDDLVGVHVDRSVDLIVSTLGVLKGGGAYVPLDPDFPAERVSLMIEDSGARVLITQQHLEQALPDTEARVVRVDDDWAEIARHGTARPTLDVPSSSLAYAIYTSGSTGTPKGVLLEHRNVVNFFIGMDAVVPHDPPGVWLAVTSLSFDISVLELFWTLARGFTVVVFTQEHRSSSAGGDRDPAAVSRGMDFGLFMWGNDDGPGPEKYRLMLDGARFFDENEFDSVWTPERHFHAFGGPFPNPSVTGAALAAVTENLSIRSGSCVSPLHHPIRVAEEWAVVDNLSDGRVGLSFAAGWQPNDFVIRPESYPGQKQVMMDQIDVVRRLWRGEAVAFENPMGEKVPVTTLPRPVQPELPFWLTTAGNPESYRAAGAMGANVLTHLLGQSLDEVAGKIAIYREARGEAGLDPDTGVVTLMLHTFVGEDDDEVREIVRQPMKDYLGASMKLVLGFAWTFPAFKRPGGPESTPDDLDLSTLSDEESDAILDFAFDRYFETSGLFGTPETCEAMVDRCKLAGVDEIACLLDFGVETDQVMASLPALARVRADANRTESADRMSDDRSFAAQVRAHGVTHLQCTPSMARLLLADPSSRDALRTIEHMMVGGEALPATLAAELEGIVSGTLTNMYGPTETTIWSSTHRIEGAVDPVPIGRPIANTSLYVLDAFDQPTPRGVPGELHISGDGVARGYHRRPELTSERFVPDPFAEAGARMYRTGDLARYRADGVVDFLGRGDRQVKVRGYRIELGEIEAALEAHSAVRSAAVVLREDEPGDQRLVAYVVTDVGVEEDRLRAHLRGILPEYMLPSLWVGLEEMPLTPNGKVDLKALPQPEEASPAVAFEAPGSELERVIAACWTSVLKRDGIGIDDNFFDVGGHSLLVVQLHRELTTSIDRTVSLVDLYRFPSIRALGDHLVAESSSTNLDSSAARAERRRAGIAQRRRRRQ